jgi:hypothetical protein
MVIVLYILIYFLCIIINKKWKKKNILHLRNLNDKESAIELSNLLSNNGIEK